MSGRSRRRAASLDWMERSETILREYGLVQAAAGRPARHHARYRARRLIQLLVEDRGYQRAQLVEHTEHSPRRGGWIWFVELRSPALTLIPLSCGQSIRSKPLVTGRAGPMAMVSV